MARAWLTGFSLGSLVFGQGLSPLLFPSIFFLGFFEISQCNKAPRRSKLLRRFFLVVGLLYAICNRVPEVNVFQEKIKACGERTYLVSESSLWLYDESSDLAFLEFCNLRQTVIGFIQRVSPNHHRFLVSVLMGEKTALDFETEDSFRRLGIFHLLVVSGSHVTLLAGFLNAFTLAFINLLGSLRILNPIYFLQARQLASLLTLIITLVYCCMTGMSAAAQRAFFVFGLHSILTKIFPIKIETSQRIFLIMALQSLCFPKEFFSGGNLLSWIAYLMILAYPGGLKARWSEALADALIPQVCISLIVLALFGEFSLIGVFANFLVIPLFSNLMTKTYAVLFLSLGFSWWIGILDALLSWFLEGISYLAIFTYKFKILYIEGLELSLVLKIMLVQLSLVFVSIRFKSYR